jgi:hypothetical protein
MRARAEGRINHASLLLRTEGNIVMAVPGLDPGLDPAIHVFPSRQTPTVSTWRRRVDGRVKPRIKSGDGHDGVM